MNTATESLVTSPVVARPSAQHIMLDVAAQREVAEVQGSMMMAKRFPRDVIEAREKIIMTCTRPELAEIALYSYARGGTEITGPSIRMAEAIAQNWGNFDFGIRELEQRAGESTVEAFALDLETNTRQRKVFQVPHVRYTRNAGRTALVDPRDVYEQVANQGARRLRACILGIIPGDVIDAAVRQVELTLKTKAEVTPERLKALEEKFATFNVTPAMIEKRVQRRIEAITPALLVQLGKIFNSIKDGMSAPGDWFEIEAAASDEGPKTATAAVHAKLRQKKAGPTAQPEPASEHIPQHDTGSAIAALRVTKTIAELETAYGVVMQDFAVTKRQLPIDVEAVYKDHQAALEQQTE